MGSRLSKQSEPEQPQLYVVPTPHPTLQYIYPVYAAPVDISKQDKKGRSSPLAWRGEKYKPRKEIQPFQEDEDNPVDPTSASVVANEDGAWYHFHVDAAGDVDYIRPGTTLPSSFNIRKPYDPQYTGSIAPSTSMAAPEPYPMAAEYQAQAAYQGYYHPQPQRISHSDAFSAGSLPYPRARSVSPVHSRAITPSNMKPRRATTPTPRKIKTYVYEPAPPVPQDIRPISPRRFIPPSRGQPLPSTPGSIPTDPYRVSNERDYRSDKKVYRDETRTRSPELSYKSKRRPSGASSPRPHESDEETTAISSNAAGDAESILIPSVQPRPYNPVPADDALYQNHHSRGSNKHSRYYPSPSTTHVHSPRFEAQYSRGRD